MLNGKFMPAGNELVECDDGSIQPVMFFYAIEGANTALIAAALGYECTFQSFPGLEDDDGNWFDIYKADPIKFLTEWKPLPPAGFDFGGKWHTEDGIEACFLRKVEAGL